MRRDAEFSTVVGRQSAPFWSKVIVLMMHWDGLKREGAEG